MLKWRKLGSLEVFKSLMLTGNADIQTRGPTGVVSQKAAKLFNTNPIIKQPAPAAKTTSTTLTAAELLGGLITGNQGAAGAAAYTLPLATDLEAAMAAIGGPLEVNDGFDVFVINISTVAAEDITMTTNTGWTLVGSMLVIEQAAGNPGGSNGHFRVRRTAANAFTLYRMA